MAVEHTEILQVFQGHISIRNIDLIITKLENDLKKGHYRTTFKFHEDISQFRMKKRYFNFAIFYGCRTYWDLRGFQGRIFIRNIDLIITNVENDLEVGHHNTTFKFHEDIPQFRMKARSLKFASPTSRTVSLHYVRRLTEVLADWKLQLSFDY